MFDYIVVFPRQRKQISQHKPCITYLKPYSQCLKIATGLKMYDLDCKHYTVTQAWHCRGRRYCASDCSCAALALLVIAQL